MEPILILAVVVALVILRKQHVRLGLLEREFASLRTQIATSPAPEEAAPAAEPETVIVEISEQPDDEPMASGPWQQAAATAKPTTIDAAGQKPDIETTLGTRWAVWVGGLALALGGIFLVRYSLEAGIFGPGIRLSFAAFFGCALAAAGEIARRKGFEGPVGGIKGAYIPSILTAAAAFTLFGATYAAHGIYGFIGPAMAFVLLGALALATIAAALLHGQALAGLGLLGSYLAPMLVASNAPNPWSLFIYLAIVLAAAVSIASMRRWQFLASAAYTGAGLWTLTYLLASVDPLASPVALLHLVGLAALGGVWLKGTGDGEHVRPDAACIAAAAFTGLTGAILVPNLAIASQTNLLASALLAAMLAVAVWHARAIALLHAAGLAVIVRQSWDYVGGRFQVAFSGGRLTIDGAWLEAFNVAFVPYAGVLAVLFLVVGMVMTSRTVAENAMRAAAWAFWAAVVPVFTLIASWFLLGNLNVDLPFALAGFALALILAGSAELVARAENPQQTGGLAMTFLVAGSAIALCFALLAGFGPILTTILTGLAAVLPAAATRMRTWPALGWISATFAAVTLARIGIDPTIAGPELLSTTPVLNALTPGYLLPAAAFAYAAWQLARTADGRARLVMEAFAALFALLGAAMLVRHAMNAGVIDAAEPMLAEQAIYTLIMIGGGAILLALDQRSPSPVFRWGSIGLGVLSMLFITLAHLVALNPLSTNESTGSVPVFNLLLLAYLLPAAASAALAWRARGLRPDWYVAMLATSAAALAFAYVTLSVRQVFQGEFIGALKGMGELETYTYSAVWLALGVALLVAGLRFGSRILRLASAVLVVAAVAKVFLYDMRQLEGVLRALSFMGLGVVLIGIGLFYQRTLQAKNRPLAS